MLYRIKFAEHRNGNSGASTRCAMTSPTASAMRWKASPTPRTLEFGDNRRLCDWVLDNITIPVHPRQYEFSRLNLEIHRDVQA